MSGLNKIPTFVMSEYLTHKILCVGQQIFITVEPVEDFLHRPGPPVLPGGGGGSSLKVCVGMVQFMKETIIHIVSYIMS